VEAFVEAKVEKRKTIAGMASGPRC